MLYYVTPKWKEDFGGSLELWDDGIKGQPRTIASKFNRLVIMKTGKESLHSVSRITHKGTRRCVSNYYFSASSPEKEEYFHVTNFRGRPGQPLTDLVLRADSILRGSIRKVFKTGIVKPWHVYKT